MKQTGLRELLAQCRQYFLYTGLFSLAINALMLASPLFMLQVFDRVLSSRSNETLVMLLAFFSFALAIAALLDMVRSRLFVRAGISVQHLLRRPVLENILQIRQQGSLNGHALEDVSTLQAFLSGPGIQALFELPWIPFYLLILYFFHPILCLIAVIGALILAALTGLEEKATAHKQKKGDLSLRHSSDYIVTALRNGEAIRALGMQNSVVSRWESLHDRHLNDSVAAVDASSHIYAVSKFIRNLMGLLQMTAAAALIINAENVTPGIMIAATIIMGRVMTPMTMVIGGWKHFIRARVAYQRLDAMLEDQGIDDALIQLPPPKGRLAVEKIHFFFAQKNVLRGIRFELAEGESLGVVGPSASGKTTLAKLLLGVYRPNEGCVRLDGVDVWQWAHNGLGRYVGYLPQSVRLFPGTVAENIARLRDVRDCAEEVIGAAKRARAHEMILKLPKGYDTDVGDDGAALSGGQRQQIGLARALFGSPRLMVLDEPNANLDGEAELLLRQLMGELKRDSVTLVVVGHKPSLLSGIDKLLVLREGRQILFGPRAEIIDKISGPGVIESSPGLVRPQPGKG